MNRSAYDRPPDGLQHSLDRLAAFGVPFSATVRCGGGRHWINAHRLFAGRAGSFKKLLKTMRARHPDIGDDVLACMMLATYSSPIVATAMGCFLIDGRVPALTLANLDLRFDTDGRVAELGFRSGKVVSLGDDPVSAAAGETVVDDVAILREHLHAGLALHFAPVVGRIRELLPVGPRVAWGNVGDQLIQAAAWIVNRCRADGSEPRPSARLDAVQEVELLMRRTDSPFFSRRGALRIGPQGRAHVERGSCCLQYHAPCGRYCANCPVLRRQKERRQEATLKR